MIVKTRGLTKKYGKDTVVNSVNIEIDKGQVYGFIGMNGAGKSTTIKMLAGLLTPTSGEMELFGKKGKIELQKVRQRISGYVDAPTFYQGMTAIENLEINSRLLKLGNNSKRINEILKIVHLENTYKKTVQQFSLGMKQRLAIGCALLNDPELIILDEPINGLDPSGIIEIRDLINDLSKNHGISFLISSHILSELEKIATTYGIIEHGTLVEQILAVDLKKKLQNYVLVESNSITQIHEMLTRQLPIENCIIQETSIKIYNSFERYDDIQAVVHQIDGRFASIKYETQTLESYFMELIGGKNNAVCI